MIAIRKWWMLTVVGVLVILLGGWFLLVQPTRAKAAEVEENISSQQQTTDQLRVSVAALQREAAELATQQVRIDELEARIPKQINLSTVIRDIAKAVTRSGATITAFTPQQPQSLNNAQPQAVAPVAAPDSAASGETVASPPTVSASSSAPSLYQVAIALTVKGDYKEIENVLAELEKFDRVLLVTSANISVEENAATHQRVLMLDTAGRIFTRTNEFVEAADAAQQAVSGTQTARQRGLG